MNTINEVEKLVSKYKDIISNLSTNKFSIASIENIQVKIAFNNKNSLKRIASINIENSEKVIIKPWEKKLILNIKEAIYNSKMGFNIELTKDALNIKIPPMTEERRIIISRKIREHKEKSKISIRLIRNKIINLIKKDNKLKKLSDEEYHRKKSFVNKYIEEKIKTIDKITTDKIQKILKIR